MPRVADRTVVSVHDHVRGLRGGTALGLALRQLLLRLAVCPEMASVSRHRTTLRSPSDSLLTVVSMDLKDDPTIQRWQRFIAILVMVCVGALVAAGTVRLIGAVL